MVDPILKCNSSNNPLIISTGIGDFEFSHSLGRQLTAISNNTPQCKYTNNHFIKWSFTQKSIYTFEFLHIDKY